MAAESRALSLAAQLDDLSKLYNDASSQMETLQSAVDNGNSRIVVLERENLELKASYDHAQTEIEQLRGKYQYAILPLVLDMF